MMVSQITVGCSENFEINKLFNV